MVLTHNLNYKTFTEYKNLNFATYEQPYLFAKNFILKGKAIEQAKKSMAKLTSEKLLAKELIFPFFVDLQTASESCVSRMFFSFMRPTVASSHRTLKT